MTGVTRDSISLRNAGVVTIVQQEKGNRFTQDSLLLADFCRIKTRDRVLEPGAGTGIVSLLLAKKYPQATFVADEVEPAAYQLLCQNIKNNGLSDRIIHVDRDIKYLNRAIAPNAFNVIVANPPYTGSGTGKTSPFAERQLARQDHGASLQAWLNLQTLLKPKGRFFLVFPASRLAELISLLKERKLEPKRLRFVHPYADKPASLVLIEALKTGRQGLEVLAPLVVHEKTGGYSEEMRQLFDPA